MRKTSLVGFAPTFYFGFKAMENGSIEEGIRRIAKEAVTANGVEFVHAEIVGTKRNLTVRVYIDKPDGVTLEDCSAVSKRMEAVLDADDFIPSAYLLEVSSPGIGEPLIKESLKALFDKKFYTRQKSIIEKRITQLQQELKNLQ